MSLSMKSATASGSFALVLGNHTQVHNAVCLIGSSAARGCLSAHTALDGPGRVHPPSIWATDDYAIVAPMESGASACWATIEMLTGFVQEQGPSARALGDRFASVDTRDLWGSTTRIRGDLGSNLRQF